jgi:hypothetical protein
VGDPEDASEPEPLGSPPAEASPAEFEAGSTLLADDPADSEAEPALDDDPIETSRWSEGSSSEELICDIELIDEPP